VDRSVNVSNHARITCFYLSRTAVGLSAVALLAVATLTVVGPLNSGRIATAAAAVSTGTKQALGNASLPPVLFSVQLFALSNLAARSNTREA